MIPTLLAFMPNRLDSCDLLSGAGRSNICLAYTCPASFYQVKLNIQLIII